MATPSLTNAGLWTEQVNVTSETTLTLKIGVWTKIVNITSSSFMISFAGERILMGGKDYTTGGYNTISPNYPMYVMRMA